VDLKKYINTPRENAQFFIVITDSTESIHCGGSEVLTPVTLVIIPCISKTHRRFREHAASIFRKGKLIKEPAGAGRLYSLTLKMAAVLSSQNMTLSPN
jgi:hypothetical protein